MAVAILEKERSLVKTEEKREEQAKTVFPAEKISDEQHNARISEMYKRLLNPAAKVAAVLVRTEQAPVQPKKQLFVEPAAKQAPYLVENARATADIFRADNPINRRLLRSEEIVDVDDEEENEDLRPTQTTIQYKTSAVRESEEADVIETASAGKRFSLSKREKGITAVVISVIVAMFALIIINSAILSGMNAEMSALQTTLDTVEETYNEVNKEVESLVNEALENVDEFAAGNGMVK